MPRFGHILLVMTAFWVGTLVVQAQQASAAPVEAKPVMGHATGRLIVDGTESLTTTTIFVTNNVTVAGDGHASLVNRGNSLVFAPHSNFNAFTNAYRLNSGGSKVASYTGMTAYLPNCFSVTPVRPDYMTLYEVDWSDNSALVYARSQDVKINYWRSGQTDPDKHPTQPDRDWIVKEGHTARIRDVKLCKPLIDFWPQPNLPTALELAGTTGFVVSIPFWGDMSPDHP